MDVLICGCVFHVLLHFCFLAAEAEQNYSEEDGWEFITLADQVSGGTSCMCSHILRYIHVYCTCITLMYVLSAPMQFGGNNTLANTVIYMYMY